MLPYPLRSAIWKASGARDAQYISKASRPAKETSIIKSISVDPTSETFRGAQRKLHTIFVTRLAY